jgi:hypothetical protein
MINISERLISARNRSEGLLKIPSAVILSEAKNLALPRVETLHFVQGDKKMILVGLRDYKA